MRIAHLIMAHKNPVQLLRLIRRLHHPHVDFFVHLDAKTDIAGFEEIRQEPNVTFIHNRMECNWGGFSFVKAIFNGLREIGQSGPAYEFINLLSAQDYPVNDAESIYAYLSHHPGKNFISFDPSDDSDWWKEAINRYQQYHFTDFTFPGQHLFQELLNKITPKRKFPTGLKRYGSSNSSWWTITGACAAHITQQLDQRPQLSRFLKFCWGTDEFVIATLVMNSPFKDQVVNDNKRYIDWSGGHAHPKLLGLSDLENISQSGMLFARKFDVEVDESILDALDQSAMAHN